MLNQIINQNFGYIIFKFKINVIDEDELWAKIIYKNNKFGYVYKKI